MRAPASRYELCMRGSYRPAVVAEQPRRAEEKGGLARAGAADDSNAFTLRDCERHTVEREHLRRVPREAGAIAHGDVAKLQCESGHAPTMGPGSREGVIVRTRSLRKVRRQPGPG